MPRACLSESDGLFGSECASAIDRTPLCQCDSAVASRASGGTIRFSSQSATAVASQVDALKVVLVLYPRSSARARLDEPRIVRAHLSERFLAHPSLLDGDSAMSGKVRSARRPSMHSTASERSVEAALKVVHGL